MRKGMEPVISKIKQMISCQAVTYLVFCLLEVIKTVENLKT